LISCLGAFFARRKRARFVSWVMDLNPDEAIAAGWLRQRSLLARTLESMLRYSFQRAVRIVVLDRFMKDRIVAKGISREKIDIIPPWSHDDAIRHEEQGRLRFRAKHGLSDKFVVMYSGNHSPCHPLDTLLEAAVRLTAYPQFAFCFVGGGKEFAKVQKFAQQRQMNNILCLPYQPLDELSASLSAADLHVVVLGEPFVGVVHPCKIYNVLRIGAPFLVIGPRDSHLTDILADSDVSRQGTAVAHGEVEQVVECLEEAAARSEWQTTRRRPASAARYSKAALLPRLIDLLTGRPADDLRTSELVVTSPDLPANTRKLQELSQP
jgi:colanic acid biosynthesis glycosyl transferase WcaI